MQTFGEAAESPRPVMTFRVAGEWLAIPVEQVDRVAQTAALCPVPLSFAQHLGLLDDGGELIPVLKLEGASGIEDRPGEERLVAILHVRGESVGLAIDAAGKVYHGFRAGLADAAPPRLFQSIGARSIFNGDGHCWLIDPDQLWQSLQTPDSP